MSHAAADHCAEQAERWIWPCGKISASSQPAESLRHLGASLGENIAYGKTSARDVVIALIVDDGLPARTHRKNIFNRSFKYAGAVMDHMRASAALQYRFAGSTLKAEKPLTRPDSPAFAPWHLKRAFGQRRNVIRGRQILSQQSFGR